MSQQWGPVEPTSGQRSVVNPLPQAVRLAGAGHLGSWQELNRSVTIPHCISNLEDSGALRNLRRAAGVEDGDFEGMWFSDSDVYKVLEAVSWEMGRAGDDGWEPFVKSTVGLLGRVQQDDGYLNSWYLIDDSRKPRTWDIKTARWSDLGRGHEMYCAGHLTQAAIARARATGDEDLLDIARRFADLLVRLFGEGQREGLPGHPEIETALIELYRLTGGEQYLKLARLMIERRGRGLLGGDAFGGQYFQDHLPVREATEAAGHSVRQLYLAAGVTDLYLETGDDSLLDAMKQLWHSAFDEKTYVTGGQGSRHRDEAFGDPYELPPDRAYAETCAAIASVMWNWRMLLATGEGCFAEEMERALYNAIAVSTSLDGRRFTYSNPLHLRAGHDGSDEDAPSERLRWFTCACCPPNLGRLVASLHHYIATSDERGIQLHLLTACQIATETPASGPVALRMATDYPWDGRVRVEIQEAAEEREWTLSLRAPAWAEGLTVSVNGEAVSAETDANGYLRMTRRWRADDQVELDVPMPVRVLTAHPRVDAVRGAVALARGPLVYCIEQADMPQGVSVEDIRIDPQNPPAASTDSDVPGAPVVLVGSAVTAAEQTDALYRELGAAPPADGSPISLTAIPYFRWGNRGGQPMRVWIPTN